jgi:hypothetical protein
MFYVYSEIIYRLHYASQEHKSLFIRLYTSVVSAKLTTCMLMSDPILGDNKIECFFKIKNGQIVLLNKGWVGFSRFGRNGAA